MEKSVIIIPSHLKAKRLPNKPLLDINGLPLILHVLKNSQKSDIKKFTLQLQMMKFQIL